MSQYGFLFDLDGVIVDTAKYHFLAWKRLADELDIPFETYVAHLRQARYALLSAQEGGPQ